MINRIALDSHYGQTLIYKENMQEVQNIILHYHYIKREFPLILRGKVGNMFLFLVLVFLAPTEA